MILWWPPACGGGTGSGNTWPADNQVKLGVTWLENHVPHTGTYVPGFQVQNKSFVPLPDVSGALLDWFQSMAFVVLTKSVVNFQNVETKTQTSFRGIWQPFNAQQLRMKPEGERAWRWFMLHADTSLELFPDDVVIYNSLQYRVMEKNDYLHYGYREYHLVEDFTGSGP